MHLNKNSQVHPIDLLAEKDRSKKDFSIQMLQSSIVTHL